MLESTETTGSIITSDTEKRRYAQLSRSWNRKQIKFQEMFPELAALPVSEPEPLTKFPERKLQAKKSTEPPSAQSKKFSITPAVMAVVAGLVLYLLVLKVATKV